jgi:hypothetical protein
MAASIQSAHPTSLVGLGVSPSHTLSIVTLHVLTLSKEESNYMFCFEDLVGCPQIIRTRKIWSESLRTDMLPQFAPQLVSKS